MVAYDLSHLTQAEDQKVIGPIQDDEALLLFALIRTMRLNRVLELGGLGGYSARNFLRAVGPEGVVYTVDTQPLQPQGPNHKVLTKSCAGLVPADLDGTPIHLVFFDCHVYDAQMAMFTQLRDQGMITDTTVIGLHDTGLHPMQWVSWAYETAGGWCHQPVERRMVNELHAMGYDAISLHMDRSRASAELPARHGLTLMQRFKPLLTEPLPVGKPVAAASLRAREPALRS
jgi:hypothetical protein